MRSNLKLQAKFHNIDEVRFIRDAADYVNMTEKQFLRLAGLRAANEIRTQAIEKMKKLQEKEAANGGNNSDLKSPSNNESEQRSEDVHPAASSESSN